MRHPVKYINICICIVRAFDMLDVCVWIVNITGDVSHLHFHYFKEPKRTHTHTQANMYANKQINEKVTTLNEKQSIIVPTDHIIYPFLYII